MKDFSKQTLAINNLTYSFINSILSIQFKGFELSLDFDLLIKIEPVKLELSVDPKCLAEV